MRRVKRKGEKEGRRERVALEVKEGGKGGRGRQGKGGK